MPLDTETSWYTNAIGFSFNHVYINNFSKDLSLRLTDCFILFPGIPPQHDYSCKAYVVSTAEVVWSEV